MKRNFKHILWRIPVMCLMAIAVSFFLNGCNEEDPEFLILSDETAHVDAGAGQKTIEVRSNSAWAATSDASWCRITNGSGAYKSTFGIAYDINTEPTLRTATITVRSKTLTETIVVTQTGVDGALTLSPGTLVYAKAGGTQTVTVISNLSWVVGAPSASWFTVSATSGTGMGNFNVIAQENKTGEARSGSVSVSAIQNGNVITKEVKIEQLANVSVIVVSPDEKVIGSLAENFTLTVISTVNWKASSSNSWLTITPITGAKGQSTISVSAAKNTTHQNRTATVTVWDTDNEHGETISVAIIQLGTDAQLEVSPTEMTFQNTSGQSEVAVSSNRAWSVQTSNDWCSVSANSGSQNGTFTISVGANTTGAERKATVTVSVAEENVVLTRTIEVTQATIAPTITVTPKEITVNNLGTGVNPEHIIVTTAVEWQAHVQSSWMRINPSTGTGNGIIKLTVDPNTTGKPRTGTITVKTIGLSNDIEVHTVTVTQTAIDAYLSVTPEKLSFTKESGSQRLIVSSNLTSWTAGTSVTGFNPWCSILGSAQGSNNGAVIVRVNDNNTGNVRTATITVRGTDELGNLLTEEITVTQSGISAEIHVSPLEKQINNTYQSFIINVTTEVQWSYRSDSDWLTFGIGMTNRTGSGTITVNAAANTTGKTRYGYVTIYTRGANTELESHTVEVVQTATDSYFSLSPKNFSLTKEGGAGNIVVSSNLTTWSATYVGDGWLTLTGATTGSNSGAVNFTVTSNVTGNTRSGVISFSGTDALGNIFTDEVAVTQSAINLMLELSTDKVTFLPADAPVNVSVTTNAAASAVTAVSSTNGLTPDWCTVSAITGGVFSITAANNDTGKDRTATVTVTATEGSQTLTRTINVTQKAPSLALSVSQPSLTVGSAATDAMFFVSADANVQWMWSYNTTQPSWVGAGTPTGTTPGNGTISIPVLANVTGQTRSTTITVVPVVGGQRVGDGILLTLTQLGENITLDVSTPELTFNNAAEDSDVVVTTNAASWSAVSSTTGSAIDWLTLTEGIGKITVNAAANMTSQAREAFVTVTAINGGITLTRTIRVTQAGYDLTLTISPDGAKTVSNAAGSLDLSIFTGEEWNISKDVAWITISPATGSGNGTATITFEKNETGLTRYADIIVSAMRTNSPVVEKTKTLRITQNAQAYADVSEYFPNMQAIGGGETKSIFYSTADFAGVTATSGSGWCTVDYSTAGKIELTLLANSTNSYREANITVEGTYRGVAFSHVFKVHQFNVSTDFNVNPNPVTLNQFITDLATTVASTTALTATGAWTLESPATLPAWLDFSQTVGTGSTTLSFKPTTVNATDLPRSVYLTFRNTQTLTTATLQVIQPADLVVPATLTLAPTGTTPATLAVQSVGPWTVAQTSGTIPTVITNPVGGSGSQSINVYTSNLNANLTPAAKTAVLTFTNTATGVTKTVAVTQPTDLYIEPALTLNVTAGLSAAVSLPLTANANWTSSITTAGITGLAVNPNSGSENNHTVFFHTLTANTTNAVKTSVVTFTHTPSGQTLTTTVTQNIDLYIAPDITLNATNTAGLTAAVTSQLTANANWTSGTPSGAIAQLIATPTSGSTGSSDIAFYTTVADANLTNAAKISTMTFTHTPSGATVTTTIKQNTDLYVGNVTCSHPTTSSHTHDNAVTANGAWTSVVTNAGGGWIVNGGAVSGTGSQTVTYTLKASTILSSHSGTITYSHTPSGRTIVVSVTR